MANTYRSDIQKLYVAYFNRPADPAGLAYWEGVVAAQAGSLDAVSGAFANSAEYRSSFSGMSHAAIIGKIYKNLFGRAAEPAGVTFWSELLATGNATIDSIVKNIADGAQLSDLIAITNKVAGAVAFTDALRTDAERDGFSGPEVAARAQAFIASITTDATFPVRTPGALIATVLRVLGTGDTYTYAQGTDTLGAGALNDLYLAPLSGGRNTLQDGDHFMAIAAQDDRGERDLLRAELGNYADTVVKPDLRYLDVVELSAVASGTRDAGVHVDGSGGASIDAWTSQRSNADLTVDRVRVPATMNTRDVVVTMRETAAGDNDFTLHFDEQSLINPSRPDSVLRIILMDANSAAAQNKPLENVPYSGFIFYFNGVKTDVSSPAINAAQTYDALVAAVAAAVAATPGLERVKVEKGAAFDVLSASGKVVSGWEVVLSSGRNSDTFSLGEDGRLTSGGIPLPLHAWIDTIDNRKFNLTSTIVLDDVGRGGSAGELEVGSAIERDFAGIERFRIEVRDDSTLQSIKSSNNALREVSITNGLTTSHGGADTPNQGKLSVLDADFGFSDVRVIDASAMTGKLSFNAELTGEALTKYAGIRGGVDVAYSGGLNDDSMQVTIDGDLLLGASDRFAYHFYADGGAGNDDISLAIVSKPDASRLQHGHDNVRIFGGDGHDIVRITGSADVIVDLGAGDDTVYTTSAGNALLYGGAGNDRFVLGTVAGVDAATSSNDTLVFYRQMGNDVVVNFKAGGSLGADQIDFTALLGSGAAFAGAAVSKAHTSITVQAQSDANDSAAEIGAMYAGDNRGTSHVFLAVDGANVAKVYTVLNTTDTVATLVGSIDLSATAWSTLTAANFV